MDVGGIPLPKTEGKDINQEILRESLIKVAVQAWRFSKVFDRLLMKLDAGEQTRYASQFRWFLKNLQESLAEAGLTLVNVEGHEYNPGMAVTPINLDEFKAEDILFVDQMLEPIIMGQESLMKMGVVSLRKVEA